MHKMVKKLYSFRWIGGGHNHVWAVSEKDALSEVDKQFKHPGSKLCARLVFRLKEEPDPNAYLLFD